HIEVAAVAVNTEVAHTQSTLSARAPRLPLENLPHIEVAAVASNTEVTHTQSTLSAKVSRLQLKSSTNLALYPLAQTRILCQSETLSLTKVPVDTPVSGSPFPLDRAYVGLLKGQMVAISGERADLPGVLAAEIATLDAVYLQCGVTYIKLKDPLTYN